MARCPAGVRPVPGFCSMSADGESAWERGAVGFFVRTPGVDRRFPERSGWGCEIAVRATVTMGWRPTTAS